MMLPLEVKITKCGFGKFIPIWFDLFPLKLRVTAWNGCKQKVKLTLSILQPLALGGIGAGESVSTFGIEPGTSMQQEVSIRPEAGMYQFEVECQYDGKQTPLSRNKIQGVNQVRVVESRSLIIGIIVGILITFLPLLFI